MFELHHRPPEPAMMRPALALTCLMLSAAMASAQAPSTTGEPQPGRVFCDQCVTYRIAEPATVPEPYRGFLGAWSDAAWGHPPAPSWPASGRQPSPHTRTPKTPRGGGSPPRRRYQPKDPKTPPPRVPPPKMAPKNPARGFPRVLGELLSPRGGPDGPG